MNNYNNIICLDIDDCIYPSAAKTDWSDGEIAIETLELNLKKLKIFMNNTDSKIFITSSWYQLFDYYPDTLSICAKDEIKKLWEIDKCHNYEKIAYKLLTFYLTDNIIGISCGNRDIDIIELSKNKNNKLIVFDDFDLSDVCDNLNNVHFERVTGCLNNDILWRSYNFLKE